MDEVRLEGIEKVYPGGHRALEAVDLTVASGELVVLLGPSGCGKSTLLRIIAGIETPTRGRVYLGNQDVTEIPPQRRDVAMVFQNYALYPHMTVRDNLGFGLRMRSTPAQVIEERVGTAAGMLGLDELLDRKPAQLSGGQRQRVALGRAIVRQARIFLLDEPLSNLDAQLRVTTRAELARLHRELGAPMIYVTHDQEEAMTLGHRVVVLSAGRVQQIGTPMEIYRRPATSFVAGFVGSPRMNLLEAVVSQQGSGRRLEGLDGRLRVELPGVDLPGLDLPEHDLAEYGKAAASGSIQVTLGIRPEEFDLVDPAEADLTTRADVVEPLGREVLLHLAFEPPLAGAPTLRVLTDPAVSVKPGSPVGLRLRPEALHLFHSETGRRIN